MAKQTATKSSAKPPAQTEPEMPMPQRMQTRGGAAAKMKKVMNNVHEQLTGNKRKLSSSENPEDQDEEEPAKKKRQQTATKKDNDEATKKDDDEATKKANALKIAELEDRLAKEKAARDAKNRRGAKKGVAAEDNTAKAKEDQQAPEKSQPLPRDKDDGNHDGNKTMDADEVQNSSLQASNKTKPIPSRQKNIAATGELNAFAETLPKPTGRRPRPRPIAKANQLTTSLPEVAEATSDSKDNDSAFILQDRTAKRKKPPVASKASTPAVCNKKQSKSSAVEATPAAAEIGGENCSEPLEETSEHEDEDEDEAEDKDEDEAEDKDEDEAEDEAEDKGKDGDDDEDDDGEEFEAAASDSDDDDSELPEPGQVTAATKTKKAGAAATKQATTKEQSKKAASKKKPFNMREEVLAVRKEVGINQQGARGNAVNQTFETPVTKKNFTNFVQGWAQGIRPPPPQPAKKPKASSVTSATTNSSTRVKSNASASSNSRTCAAITEPAGNPFLPKPPKTTQPKRREDKPEPEKERALPTTAYGGMEDEDDTLEQQAAMKSPLKVSAAAKKSKANLKVKSVITTPAKPAKTASRSNNTSLPPGTLNGGRWTNVFIPTFLKVIGGDNKDIWGMGSRNTITTLQMIWNAVYAGDEEVNLEKIVHSVKHGEPVHTVPVQRGTEWRNSIGSTALTVVNDMMDSAGLDTTEKRQEAAADLLFKSKFAFSQTKEETVDGQRVLKKAGRYRGGLVVWTLAQHLIDVQDGIAVPGLTDDDEFPRAALALAATAVHRALWLWEQGHITYETYQEAKTTGSKNMGVIKVAGPDGRPTKATNFSKAQWHEVGEEHIRDVWGSDEGKLRLVLADAEAARDTIEERRVGEKRRAGGERKGPTKRARREYGSFCIESDDDF